MDFLKNLFGDAKPEYSDKIPDLLKPDQFGVYLTFRHGFLSHPSCVAYDSVQYLLAIGSHQGSIAVIGKPALEKHFSQPDHIPVVQLVFVENKGHLISRCTDNSIYLWNIKDKLPFIEHKLEFQKDVPCLMSLTYLSKWLYVGMEGGNIHIVDTESFEVSGYTIYWDKVTAHEAGHRSRPGDTIGIQEHPLDPSKVLLAYSGGLCVLWNIKNKLVEKRFKLHKSNTSVLLSVDWHSSGKQFSAAYSDGSIAIYNMKSEGKPEKQYHPHGSIGANSPITKLQWIVPDGADPLYVFSGGFPDGGGVNVKSLTFHDPKSTSLLNFEQPIVDFLSLASSPHVTDAQRLFAVVILTETELIVHDLQSQNYPMFGIPYSFNINYSPVTAIGYYGNCPDDFVAELQSVLSKIPQEIHSTKRWPLSGGRWGQETPDPWTDLILTGHENGAIRVWYCKSVISQPLLTIESSNYLKESNTKKAQVPLRSPSGNSPPTVISKSAHELPPMQLTTPTDMSSGTDEAETPTNLSPKLFRLNSDEDGNLPSPKLAKRRSTKLFSGLGGKKSKKVSTKPRVDKVPESHDLESHDSETSEPSSPQSGGGLSPKQSQSKLPTLSEQETLPEGSPKPLPPSKSASVPVLPLSQSPESAKPTARTYTLSSPSPSSESYTVLSLTDTSGCTSASNINNSSINYIRMEPQAQTLCIATSGGHALCMDFSLKPVDRAPQSININFAEDSIIKPDEDESRSVSTNGRSRPDKLIPATPTIQFEVSFNNDKDKSLPGFHVLQHCFGYYGNQGIHVSDMRFNKHRDILVMGTDHGLSIVDVNSNSCIKTLSYLDSILYVADPSNHSRQCRKIVEDLYPSDGSTHKPRPLSKTNRDHINKLLSPLVINDTSSNGTKIVSDSEMQCEEEMITCIEVVEMFVNKSGESSLTIWVATKTGKLCVYIINTVSQQGKQRKIDLLPSGIVLDMKSLIINMIFLSEWGERLINPYMTNGGTDSTKSSPAIVAIKKRRRMSSREAVETEKSVNYAIISTRERIKSIGFPSNHNVAEVKPNLSNELIVGSEFMSCDGLPCIVSWSTCGQILIHTLPGLKPMLQLNHTPLLDYRSLHSFKLSCDGQGLYLATPSQLQRFSLLKSNQLNYPTSLPDIHVNKEDPHPASKGIFQALFKPGTTVDRNDLYGIEAAGKAWRSVAKKDESLEPTKREKLVGKGTGKSSSSGGGGGAGNALQEAREKLDQRGKDLSEIEQRTEQLQDDATDFANVARQLAEKQKKKRIF